MQLWKLVAIQLVLIFTNCLVLVINVINPNQGIQYPSQANIQATQQE